MIRDQDPDQSKLNEEVKMPEMQAKLSANNESSTPPGPSSKDSLAHHEQPVLLVPRSVYKSASAAQKMSKKRNRYLEPFVNLNRRKKASKSSPEVVIEVFDDDSSSTSNDEDLGEDDVRLLLNLNDDTSSKSSGSDEKPEEQNVALKMPKTPQCQRSLLEVSSIPALRSPSKGSTSATSTPDVSIISDGLTAERFLSKLRIWNSAVEAQSNNMNLGNQLNETIDVIKKNVQKITEESSNIVQLTANLKSNATEIATARSIRVSSPREHPFGFTPPPTTLRPRSCECFGCQKTFNEPVGRPLSSPLYDHKRFQRALFEQNPRYGRTIRKICALGDSVGGEKRSGIAQDRSEKAKRAAQIFLQSLHVKPNNERSSNTRSSSRTDCCSLASSNTYREDDIGLVGFESYCSLADNVTATESDPSKSNSTPCEIQSSIETDFATELNVQCTTSEDGGSFSSTLCKIASTFSDEGEILSQGEVK
uniref:Uncharacterized protein n=1 Tax=Anopheles atroparvus TaxID=41427 RepID=A0AAG5D018_ANOAO